MLLVWLLALIGLMTLVGLSALAIIGAVRTQGSPEPEDAFDIALAAVSRLQAAAWSSIQEIRQLDGDRKGDE